MNILIIISIIISLYVVYKIFHKYLHLLRDRVKNPNFIRKAKSGSFPEIIESNHFHDSSNINEYSFTLWLWITDSNYTIEDKNPWKHILHKGDSFANKCQPAIWLNTKTNQLIILYDLVERAYSYSEFKKDQYYLQPFRERIDNKTLGEIKKKCSSMSNCKGISLACEDIKDPCSRCHHGLFKTDLNEELQSSQTYINSNIPGGLPELEKNYKDIGTLQKNMRLPSMNPNINPKIINHPYLIKTIDNIPIGRWMHLGITCNSASSAIYLDGVLKDTIIFPCNIQMNHNNLYVNTLNNGFTGLITQIRYFSRSITQYKVYEIYKWGPEPYKLPDITKFNLTLNKWIFCDEPLFTIRGKSLFNIFGFNRRKKESSNDFIKWYQIGNKIYRYNIILLTYIETKNYQSEYHAEMMNSVSEMENDASELNKIYKDIEFSKESRSLLIKLIKDKIPNYYKDMSFTKFDKRKLKLVFEDLSNGLIFGTYDYDSTNGIDKCGIKKLPIPSRPKYICPDGKILKKDGIECEWPSCPNGMDQNSDTGKCTWKPCKKSGMIQDPNTGNCSWKRCEKSGMIQEPNTGNCSWQPCEKTGMKQDPNTGNCSWHQCGKSGMILDPLTGNCSWQPCEKSGMIQDLNTGNCSWQPCEKSGMIQDLNTGNCSWKPCEKSGMIQDPNSGNCAWKQCGKSGMILDSKTGNCSWKPCEKSGMIQDSRTGDCNWKPCEKSGMIQDSRTGNCSWQPCAKSEMIQDPNSGTCTWQPCEKSGMIQDSNTGTCSWKPCEKSGMIQDSTTGDCKNPPLKPPFYLDFENKDYLFSYGSTFFNRSDPDKLPHYYYNLEFKKGGITPKLHHSSERDPGTTDKGLLRRDIIGTKRRDFRENSIAYRLFEKNKTDKEYDFFTTKIHFECYYCRDDHVQVINVSDLIDELYEGLK